ncbi:MAG: protein phosphatase 2C domain-containing protein [Cyanobacteria bacterium J06623_7]
MSHPEPQIQCSNPHCAASNSLEASVCSECSTPIVRRYLWSSDKAIAPEQKTTLVDDRYLALTEQIFLDTKPKLPPLTPEEVPAEIAVYLQLFAYYPHIPQPHGLLSDKKTWLFDYGTVPTDSTGELTYGADLLPKVKDLWKVATPLQQLNWLWQIAKLWRPLAAKRVVSTLIEPNLIRINGQILQLIYLQPDLEKEIELRDLGNLWSQWAETAHPSIKEVVLQLAVNLETGAIAQANQLAALLDRAISLYCETQQYSYQIYAMSDSGPSRSNNEDAAYPLCSKPEDVVTAQNALAIVCDGVGGHDGGEIASGETSRYLQQKISALSLNQLNPPKISKKLTKYIKGANDIISKRNDSEQRQERQRMGTTLVMTLSAAQQVYLAHVGDSRIYWITANSCHQMTIDDDLASREVRLGYALYRDSLQYPSAGALIQALGMRDSAALHPNLQRFIIDGECVFVLCTDGLSDFDRVEQQWQHKILPILAQKQDIASAVKDLIAFANQHNGHDNVTVALVHCQVQPKPDSSQIKIRWSDLESTLTDATQWSDDSQIDSSLSNLTPTEASSAPTAVGEVTIGEQIGESYGRDKQPKWLKPLILLLLISTTVGLLAYKLLQSQIDPDSGTSPETTELETETETEIETGE